jgi:Tfp pilus assembly protein PilO
MNPIKKIYISIMIFTIFYALLIVFLIYPSFKQIAGNSEGFLLEKNKIAAAAQEVENRKKMENLYKIYQPDLDKIEKIFIDPDVPLEFIDFLENTASSSHLELEIFSMEKKLEKDDPWPSLLFQLSAVGTFPDFSEFLEKLEKGPYLIETLNLSTRSLGQKESGAKESENLRPADTNNLLSIKVFTK